MDSQFKDNTVEELCQGLGILPATFYSWKAMYGGMGSDESKRMKELESENARLRKPLAEKSLDYDILQVDIIC